MSGKGAEALSGCHQHGHTASHREAQACLAPAGSSSTPSQTSSVSLGCSLWGSVKGYPQMVWWFLKKLNLELLYALRPHGDVRTPVLTAALFTVAKGWKQLK